MNRVAANVSSLIFGGDQSRLTSAATLIFRFMAPIRDHTIMETANNPEVPLIGSPYDLRVSLGERVSEMDIRTALESGECGFVHSFTTGSAVDGPGVRVVAWLSGCQFR